MGFLDGVLGGVGKMIAEQMVPVFKSSMRYSSSDLKKMIDSEERLAWRATYLLVLAHKDKYDAVDIYKARPKPFDNAFLQLQNHRFFAREIELFRNTIASASY